MTADEQRLVDVLRGTSFDRVAVRVGDVHLAFARPRPVPETVPVPTGPAVTVAEVTVRCPAPGVLDPQVREGDAVEVGAMVAVVTTHRQTHEATAPRYGEVSWVAKRGTFLAWGDPVARIAAVVEDDDASA